MVKMQQSASPTDARSSGGDFHLTSNCRLQMEDAKGEASDGTPMALQEAADGGWIRPRRHAKPRPVQQMSSGESNANQRGRAKHSTVDERSN